MYDTYNKLDYTLYVLCKISFLEIYIEFKTHPYGFKIGF